MDTFSLSAKHDLISAFTLFTYWTVSCFKGFSDLSHPWWISMEIIGKHGHILFSEALVSSACRITNLRWWGKTISSYMSAAPHHTLPTPRHVSLTSAPTLHRYHGKHDFSILNPNHRQQGLSYCIVISFLFKFCLAY